jgi:hypothetical protein
MTKMLSIGFQMELKLKMISESFKKNYFLLGISMRYPSQIEASIRNQQVAPEANCQATTESHPYASSSRKAS